MSINTPDKPLHLLLIDDDPDDMLLFEEAVKQSLLAINISVADPSFFYSQLESKRPDIVLLDINMPVKDGLEYLKELRENELYKDLPVIMYSTSRYKINDSFTAGATKYFVKPKTFNDLKKLVQIIYDKSWKSRSATVSDDFFLDFTIPD